MSNTRESLHAVVAVVFRRSDGFVIGTFVHGSRGGPDPAGVESSRQRFLKETRERRGGDEDVDSVLVPLEELAGRWIERIDPTTRTALKSGPRTGGPVVFP